MRLASGTGNRGWSRTRPELVCFLAWWLRSKNSVCIRGIKKRELVNMYREHFKTFFENKRRLLLFYEI